MQPAVLGQGLPSPVLGPRPIKGRALRPCSQLSARGCPWLGSASIGRRETRTNGKTIRVLGPIAEAVRPGPPGRTQRVISAPLPQYANVVLFERPARSSIGPMEVDLSSKALVRVTCGRWTVVVARDGQLELWEREGGLTNTGQGRDAVLASRASLTLPRGSAGPCKVRCLEAAQGPCVQVMFGEGARLRLFPVDGPPRVGGEAYSWSKNLAGGFMLEYSVSREEYVVDEFGKKVEMAEVVVDLQTSGRWYGGGHLMVQHWPLDSGCWEVGPMYPFDNGPTGQNTLVSPSWMTSTGLVVMADPETPFLHVGVNAMEPPTGAWWRRKWTVGWLNMARFPVLPLSDSKSTEALYGPGDGKLRIQARSSYECHRVSHPLKDWRPHHWDALGQQHPHAEWLTATVAMCKEQHVRAAAQRVLSTHENPPTHPPADMIEKPIWTTWARYKARVSQDKVLRYAGEVVARGFPYSIMEIDDRWQTRYGDLEFDRVKFPDPRKMVDELHELGFKVTCWVHPFVAKRSAAYAEGARKGYFITQDAPGGRAGEGAGDSGTPGFFSWWNSPKVTAIDLTNHEAVDWFLARLRALQAETGLDGFKFDAGEPCFLPARFRTKEGIEHPSEYTRLWVEKVAGHFSYAEVRTGHRTTGTPVFTRMGDRFSSWGVDNGLGSLIPTLLTSGLLGYPFCLPDMIGGNAYFAQFPSKDLLVRWAQANALMPGVQFSIAPWDLSESASRLCLEPLALRAEFAGDILGLAEESCHTLAPICRPLWWLDPLDPETFTIMDQFAIGQDVVVAPVLQRNARKRDVYLPAGEWQEVGGGREGSRITGPRWIKGLRAPLDKLPVFRRITSAGP